MTDFDIIRVGLTNAYRECRYHGAQFARLGVENGGLPRCDSCKLPWRIAQALTALDRIVLEHRTEYAHWCGALLDGKPCVHPLSEGAARLMAKRSGAVYVRDVTDWRAES